MYLGVAGVLLATMALVAYLWMPELHESRELRLVRKHTYLLTVSLELYVKRHGRFPDSLAALYAEDSSHSLMNVPMGCYQLYKKPAWNAPPKTTVMVICYGDKQAMIRKDFHMIIWP
jgi:hypothetical protein